MQRLRFIILTAMLAIGTTLWPATAHAQTAAPALPGFGVQFHVMWEDYSDQQRIEVLDKLAGAGIKWVRIDVDWPSLQGEGRGSHSQWAWDRLDFAVNAARARGIDVLATLWRTPPWANGSAGATTTPNDPADYGTIAFELAGHFRGRVAAWEIWNEPNSSSFFDGSVAQYVGLMKAAYPRFKEGDPNATVVIGGPQYNDVAWLTKVYEAGAAPSFDVMSVHTYMSPSDLAPETNNGTIWTIAGVSQVHDLMVRNGDGAKPVWITEFGWSAHPNDGTEQNWARGVTLEQQADYAVRALRFVGADFPYVQNMFWYNERDRDSGNVHEDGFGLLYRDLAEKPVYRAIKSLLTGISVPALPTASPSPVTTPTASPAPTSRRKRRRIVIANGGFGAGRVIGWRTVTFRANSYGLGMDAVSGPGTANLVPR